MNVKTLREKLDGYPDDTEVHVALPTHNHWGNVRALPLNHVGQCDVAFSAYLNSKQVLVEDHNPEELDADPECVVILADDSTTLDV